MGPLAAVSARPSAPLSTTSPYSFYFFCVCVFVCVCVPAPELLRFNSTPSAAHEDRGKRRQGDSGAHFSPSTLCPNAEDALVEVSAARSATGHDGQLRPSAALFSGERKLAFNVCAAQSRTPCELFSYGFS